MQFVYVIAYHQKKKFSFYIGFATCKESFVLIITFQYTKGPFNLNRTVHPQQCSCFWHDVFIWLLPVSYKFFWDAYLPVTGTFCTLPLKRASAAAFTLVMARFGYEPAAAFASPCISECQFSAKVAGIFILFSIIGHVFTSAYVVPKAFLLPFLIRLGFYICFLPVIIQINSKR